MDDVFEAVVAENRRLRKEVKTLYARVAAVEASRWWRIHPRFVLKRLQRHRRSPDESQNGNSEAASRGKLAAVAEQWRLRLPHEQLNRDANADEIVLREGLRLKVHPDARHAFEHFCYWSPQMVDELDVFLANTADRRRLLDVGAFHGLFSLVFAVHAPDKQALAVDPSPIAFARLLYNIHKNRARNITAVECALSNAGGTLEMHYEWEQAVAGYGDSGGEAASLRADSRTGDDLCEARSFEPDTLKIDVEGHEANVVEGLRGTIARTKPLIFLELHPAAIAADQRNGTVHDLVRHLRELGYAKAELRDRVVPVEGLADCIEIERCLLRPDSA
jgi:FkbM family methyltransferase